MYGSGFFYEDAFNAVLPEAYEAALNESGIDPVSRPEIDVLSVEDGVVLHFNCIGHLFEEGVCKGFSPLFEIWFRYYRQVVEGISDAQVCPLWKRGCYNLIALLHPVQKVFAYCFDPIHPWISDFVQRMIFFSWVRRKRLWI